MIHLRPSLIRPVGHLLPRGGEGITAGEKGHNCAVWQPVLPVSATPHKPTISAARLGRTLLSDFAKTWPAELQKLRTLNGRCSNTTWESRTMIAGRLSKASICVVLAGNVLKQTLAVPLSDHESDVAASSQTARR